MTPIKNVLTPMLIYRRRSIDLLSCLAMMQNTHPQKRQIASAIVAKILGNMFI